MSRPKSRTRTVAFFGFVPAVMVVGGLAFWSWPVGDSGNQLSYVAESQVESAPVPEEPREPVFVVSHLPTPEPLKALYMTSWVAGTPSIRERVIKLATDTEVNSLVIDIKDYSGKIVFETDRPEIVAYDAVERRIPEIKELIGRLHDEGIYVIGRVAVFQDAHLVAKRPELAVKAESTGAVWRDRKGIPWLDVSARPVWEYAVAIAEAAYEVGFDEINFDYIRFPSDGNMRDIAYPFFDSAVTTREAALEEFFAYIHKELAGKGIVTSADLFGLTTSASDDLGIGQTLESAAPYFDYIAPMVYPSHYASGYLNLSNPAAKPYEVVKNSMDLASAKLLAASSTPAKLRPWLQDFDLGADYTAPMVRAQIQATYDAGLTSWMLWDPSNKYTKEALLP